MFEALFVSEQGIFDAIFDEFRNNSIGIVSTLQKHIIYKYFIYIFFDCYHQNVAMSDIYIEVRSSMYI